MGKNKDQKTKVNTVIGRDGFSPKAVPPKHIKDSKKPHKMELVPITETKSFQKVLNKLNATINKTNLPAVPQTGYVRQGLYAQPKVEEKEPIVNLGFFWPITHGIPEEKEGLFMYHICSDGMYCSKTLLGGKYITYKVDKIEGLPKGKEDTNVLDKKLPAFLLNKTVEFFKFIIKSEKKSLEAFVLYGYNPETEKYFMWVPEQEISAAAVSYDISKFQEEYPGCIVVGDAHSHNTMGEILRPFM